MLRKSPLCLIPAGPWAGILPAALPTAGKQNRWGLVPAPLASRRLQTFPNSRPTCHGGRAGRLSGAPGRLPGPPAAGASPSPWRPPAPLPGRGRLGLPHLQPGPSATRSPRGAPPASAPRSCGPEPVPGWARAAASSAEGIPRTVNAPGPAPSPARSSASHLPPPPPLHAPPGRGPDPTRSRTAPLSPWAGPGRSRGLS